MRDNLEELGFQVEVAENLTGLGIKKKVGSFVQRHKRAACADGARGAEVRASVSPPLPHFQYSGVVSILAMPRGTSPGCIAVQGMSHSCDRCACSANRALP